MQKNDYPDEVVLKQAQRVWGTKTAGETVLSDVTVLLTLRWSRLWRASELLIHATERSYTDAWMVRVAGAMDQRRLLILSTTGPAKRVSPH